METLDLIFRGASTGLLCLFALQMWFRQRNIWVSIFGTLLSISIIGYVWAPLAYRTFGNDMPALPVYFAGHVVALALWLFALTLFEDGFKPRWVHWAVAGVFVVTFAVRRLPGAETTPGLLFGGSIDDDRFVLEHMLYLAVLAATMIRVGAGFSADMVERRRRLRGFVIVGVGAYALLVIVVELAMGQVPSGPTLDLLNSVSIFVLTLAIVTFTTTFVPNGLIAMAVDAPPPRKPEDPDQADQLNIAKLNAFFIESSGHRKEGLTIAELAESIGLPEYRARRLINQSLGFRNFNALLNEYRVRDACEALSDPEKSRLPVLTIALDVGYRSLGPFNRAFKELTGMTPTEYRREKLDVDPTDS